MGKVYVPERQVEFWTNHRIVVDLELSGFDVTCVPIDQGVEKSLGVDAVFVGDRVKLFGLQHKALHEGSPEYWDLKPTGQLATLRQFEWAYYCLSDIKSPHQRRQALNLARFVRPQTVPGATKKIPTSGLTPASGAWYQRWGVFLDSMSRCRIGVDVDDPDDLIDHIASTNEAGALEAIDLIGVASWHLTEDGPRPAGIALAMTTLDARGEWTSDPDDFQ